MNVQGHVAEHDRVDAALREWRQGDCVLGEQWFVYRIDPEAPLQAASKAAVAQGAEVVEAAEQGLVVLTQTCDLVRSCRDRPFVEVAPLVEVGEDDLRQIEKARMPRYAYVPALSDRRLGAHLDQVMTVEKAVVAGWKRVPGWAGDDEGRRFASALARKRVRFPFPDDFTEFAAALQARLRSKHEKKSDEGAALRALREIRVRAAPSWDGERVDVMFWFIRDESREDFEGKPWNQLLDKWLDLLPSGGRFDAVGIVTSLDGMTARDCVESDPLDLDHLSRRAG